MLAWTATISCFSILRPASCINRRIRSFITDPSHSSPHTFGDHFPFTHTHKASWIELFVCSLVCPRADCAHFVVLIVRASPAWHTNSTSSEEGRPKTASDWSVATAQDLAAYRRLREHHGSQLPSMAWICVCCRTENAAYRRKCSNSECRFAGGPPEAWDEKRGKGKRKDKQHLPKHTWHSDGCGEENSSRRWSCSSCGAKPPESGTRSAAAQPKKRPVSQRQNFAEAETQERRRVQATLPMESRSQADSETTDVKIDEDSSQDRDKGNTKEIANKLKDLDSLIRQLQPCARDDVASLLEEKKQERDELKIQLQNYKPLHQRLRLATEAMAKASKALESAKRQEADIVELLPLKRAEVDQHASPAQQQCRTVGAEISDGGRQCKGVSLRITRGPDAGGATLADPVDRGVPQMPQRRSAGRLRRLLQGDRTKPGLGAHRRPRVAGAFAPFPRARAARMDPYLAPPPQGVPLGHSSARPYRHIHTRTWGAKCSTGCTSFFSTFTVARPGAARSHGCFSSPRPLVGRLRASVGIR